MVEKEKQVFEKRNFYTEDDSGKVYILSLITPILTSLIIFMICSSISAMAGLDPAETTEQVWFVALSSVFTTLTFLAIYFIYNKKFKISYNTARFDFKISWQNYLLAIFIGVIALFGLQNFVNLFDELWALIGYQLRGTSLPTNTIGYLFLNIFVAALAPAICEEIVFRGMILNGLRSKFKDSVSIVLSALMFALMHGNLQQLVYPFLFGMCLALIYMRTGSIISCMIAHFTNNFLVILFSYLGQKTGFSMILPTTWWGILLSILLAVIVFILIFVIDKFYFKHHNNYDVPSNTNKTSLFLWVSLGVATFLFIFNLIYSLV